MNDRKPYAPGAADVAHVQNDGATWTLVLVKDLRHPPETVWRALTEPAHLREWAPFDASGDLGNVGTVNVTWVGAPAPVLCAIALIVPGTPQRPANLAPFAAAFVAAEMLLLSGVHLASGSTNFGPVVYWLVVALICTFVVYGRRTRAAKQPRFAL